MSDTHDRYFIATVAIYWGMAYLFPEIIRIENLGTLAVASVFMLVFMILLKAVCLPVMGLLEMLTDTSIEMISESPLAVAIHMPFFALAMFAPIIVLYILNGRLPGLLIDGFWSKVLVTVCVDVFWLMLGCDLELYEEEERPD